MTLRNEIDALMKAEIEQHPEWHRIMEDNRDAPEDPMTLRDTVLGLMAMVSVQRKAILRLADEIDAREDR